jgi:hypothetical protein
LTAGRAPPGGSPVAKGLPVGRQGLYESVKRAIQDLIAPDLERIKGELVAVRAEIKAVDSRVGTLEKRVSEGLRAVNDRIHALFDEQS